MTAPPIKHRGKLTCAAKTRHPDEFIARAVAMDAIARYRNTNRLFVYPCPYCHGWHLTRNPNHRGAVRADNPVELTA